MDEVIVAVEAGAGVERQAAGIWARATAQRDGGATRGPEQTLPGIRRRLAIDGAALMVARQRGDTVGFAVLAPRQSSVEVFYLAVTPAAWGTGVGSMLLAAIDQHAQSLGRPLLELWVIDDNARAIATYERAGWSRTDELHQEPPGSPVERRLVKHVQP